MKFMDGLVLAGIFIGFIVMEIGALMPNKEVLISGIALLVLCSFGTFFLNEENNKDV